MSDPNWRGREIDIIFPSGDRVVGVGIDHIVGAEVGGAGVVWTIDRSALLME